MVYRKLIYLILILFAGFTSCSEDLNTVVKENNEIPVVAPQVKSPGIVFLDSIFHNMVNTMNLRDFYCDTSRLSDLAGYAYNDLRKTPFRFRDAIMTNELNLENHILNKRSEGSKTNELLTGLWNGKGYFFAYCETYGVASKNGSDFAVEKWNIDTSVIQDLDGLAKQWRIAYHPMPFHFIEKPDCIYAIYTRSVGFTPLLDSVRNLLD